MSSDEEDSLSLLSSSLSGYSSSSSSLVNAKRRKKSNVIVSSDDSDEDDKQQNKTTSSSVRIKKPSHSFERLNHLKLKEDYQNRPLWVTPSGLVILERSNAQYEKAQSFLAAIADPIKRTEFIQEWQLTPYALHAGSSIEMQSKEIIRDLDIFSKVFLAEELKRFIMDNTENYGKVKLVWKNGLRYVESTRPDLLVRLLEEETISSARVAQQEQQEQLQTLRDWKESDEDEEAVAPRDIAEWEGEEGCFHFGVDATKYEQVKKAALGVSIPLVEEFDYRRAPQVAELDIHLKNGTKIRSYQEEALKKMFGNGRAKSGVFVLPCGAGKTLTGIVAICTIHKSALVLCNNTVAVDQWKRQLHQFADVRDELVCRFTSKRKDPLPQLGAVLISTYSMFSVARRGKEGADAFEELMKREWGLLVLDEVHVSPAHVFRRVVSKVRCHAKLGLTATLVREDTLIQDLSFLVGPKLHEANWMDLAEQGFLARVLCQEVRVPMTAEFMAEYLKRDELDLHLGNQLIALAPHKVHACEYLMRLHEQRGDRVLIFCDNVEAILFYAATLSRPVIYGATSDRARAQLLSSFQHSQAHPTLLLSKVGDLAIDLPEATVIIQVSSLFGSRRQEAQRLGRILRPKRHAQNGFNAFFYSLIVADTREMRYARKRQRFLVEQGYYYRVVEDIGATMAQAGFVPSALVARKEQVELLVRLIVKQVKQEEEGDEEEQEAMQTSARVVVVEEEEEVAVQEEDQVDLAKLSGGGGFVYRGE